MKRAKKPTASDATSLLPEVRYFWDESTHSFLPMTLEDVERELKWLLKHGLIEIVPGSDILDPCYQVKTNSEAGNLMPNLRNSKSS